MTLLLKKGDKNKAANYHPVLQTSYYWIIQAFSDYKGRFLEFRRYHNFANLFSKLSESTFYKEISKCQ